MQKEEVQEMHLRSADNNERKGEKETGGETRREREREPGFRTFAKKSLKTVIPKSETTHLKNGSKRLFRI